MKIIRSLLLLTLMATSFGAFANSDQLLGAWKCGSVLPVSWLDALSLYSPDGSFKGVANSITETDATGGIVEFDLYVDGSWSLDNKKLTTDITNIDVIPKNSQAEKELKIIRDAVNQPSLLHSEQEVIVLTNDTLKTKNKDGVVDSCRRVISASALKNKS
ncbi:hypothetical protein ACVFI8_05365 [Agarivorans sp. MS3-6]